MNASSTRTIELATLAELREDLYTACALLSALGLAMEGAKIAHGLPELVETIENTIDAAAERIHLLTFPETAGRAAE